MPQNTPLHLITVSYAPDAERCFRLCESIDRHNDPSSIQHLIVCPARDESLFSTLAAEHRTITTYQKLLPNGYKQLPWLKGWWLDPGFFPIRGWMMQQIVKMAAAAQSDSEVVVFVDSDIVCCKPFNATTFYPDQKIRLLTKTLTAEDKDHTLWQRLSERLLWITPQQKFPNYVGQLISWSPEVIKAMLARVEKNADKPWYKTLGRLLTVSEYTLYGNFAEHVYSGDIQHQREAHPISLDLWLAEDLERLKNHSLTVTPNMVAVLVQSNLGLSLEQENVVLKHALQALQNYHQID